MSNWWAKKIGSPQRSGSFPAPPSTGVYPPNAFPTQTLSTGPDPLASEAPFVTDENGKHPRLWTWRGNPKGGALDTQKLGDCPNCGSARYFSRSGGSITTQNGVATPRPECWDCGYPNDQGASIAGPAKVVGGIRVARQDEAHAPDGSLGHLRE